METVDLFPGSPGGIGRVLEVTMRDGNHENIQKPTFLVCFRSDYEGWKHKDKDKHIQSHK